MTREQQFSNLRNSLSDGLSRLETEGADMRDVGAQISRAGIAISLAAAGPTEALSGLLVVFDQLAREFPADAAAAEAGCGFPFAKGTA